MNVSKSLTKTIVLPSGRLFSVEMNPQTFTAPEDKPLTAQDRKAIVSFLIEFYTSILADVP